MNASLDNLTYRSIVTKRNYKFQCAIFDIITFQITSTRQPTYSIHRKTRVLTYDLDIQVPICYIFELTFNNYVLLQTKILT